MIVAVVWPRGMAEGDLRPEAREAAGLAGRYLAAAGHGLLLDAAEGPARLTAEAYRAAGGPRLVGVLAGEAPPGAFDEAEAGLGPEALAGRVAERADALLFLGPPELAALAAARRSGKPRYAVAALCRGDRAPDGDPRLLPDMEAFARELAKGFSRRIASRPDPMAERLRRMGSG